MKYLLAILFLGASLTAAYANSAVTVNASGTVINTGTITFNLGTTPLQFINGVVTGTVTNALIAGSTSSYTGTLSPSSIGLASGSIIVGSGSGTGSATPLGTGVQGAMPIAVNSNGGLLTSVGTVFYGSAYGMKSGRMVYDGVFTSGSSTFTSATASFTSADVGSVVAIPTGTTTRQIVTIASVVNTGTALLASTSSATLSGSIVTFGPDNTTALQNAINAASGALGGDLKIASGIYMVTGTLTNTSTLNSVISIPSSANATQPLSLVIEGGQPPAFAYSNLGQLPHQSGTILYFTNQTVSGSVPACFATVAYNYSGGSFGFENNYTMFKNLTIREPGNPSMTAIQWIHGGGIEVDHCSFDLDTYYTSTGNPTPDPTAGAAAGVICPKITNNAWTKINACYVYGWYTGIEIGEHCELTGFFADLCKRGICCSGNTNDGTFGAHTMYISRACIARCTYAVECTSSLNPGPFSFYIGNLDIEQYTGSGATGLPSWCTQTHTVDDANNYWNGTAIFNLTQAGPGYTSTIPDVNGGSHLLWMDGQHSNEFTGPFGINTGGATGTITGPLVLSTSNITFTHYPLWFNLIAPSTGTGFNSYFTIGTGTTSSTSLSVSYNVGSSSAQNAGAWGTVFNFPSSGNTVLAGSYQADNLTDRLQVAGTETVTGVKVTALASGGMVKATSSTGSLTLGTAGTDYTAALTIQTGTLVGGTATLTVPSGCHPWVVDTAASITNVGALTVRVSGTSAVITSNQPLDTSTFNLFNAGSQ